MDINLSNLVLHVDMRAELFLKTVKIFYIVKRKDNGLMPFEKMTVTNWQIAAINADKLAWHLF